MVIRYDKRLQDEDLWQVYDITTGRVVVIAGHFYDGMAQHEAAEIVALLESGVLSADPCPEAPLPDEPASPSGAVPAAAGRIPSDKS